MVVIPPIIELVVLMVGALSSVGSAVATYFAVRAKLRKRDAPKRNHREVKPGALS